MHIERELKFRLTREALPRLKALAPARRSVASIYYDTPDERLRRAGAALRLRRDGKRWLQTLKSEAAQHAGVAARAEWETEVRGKTLQSGALPRAEIKAAAGLDIPAIAHRLRPAFATRFVRHSGEVRLRSGGRAEICIDQGTVSAGRRREPIQEVELELKSGSVDELLRFAERLSLPLAYESKAERGYRLAAGAPRTPRKWHMPAVNAAATPETALAAIAAAALAQAGTNALGVIDGADPEYLHQMRVGLRRLRSALHAFEGIVKNTKALKRRLRRLAKTLGPARDWDVLAQSLESSRADRGLVARVRRRRNNTARMTRAAAEGEFQEFLLRALRWLHSAPWRRSTDSLAGFGARSLERLRAKIRPADWRSEKRRHKLRIRVKRLRYACEFFEPCFAPGATTRYVGRLRALQEVLGELNDIAVGRKLVAKIGERCPAEFDARERRLVGALGRAWKAFENQPPYWRAPV